MTKMLAAIDAMADIETAAAAGVDVLDLRNPSQAAVSEAVRLAGGRCEILCRAYGATAYALRRHAEDLFASGADYVSVPLSPSCSFPIVENQPGLKLVAVVSPADAADPDLEARLAAQGFGAMLLDAGGERLLARMAPHAIRRHVETARALGLQTWLCGRLEAPDVPRLLPLGPDLLAFDVALRSETGGIDAEAVALVRSLVREERRGIYPEAALSEPQTDKVFVRDFVLPVDIGAYSSEKGRAQRVRFDVVAHVLRPAETPKDLRDIFSYDVILDGIRSIVAEGHVQLNEELAERIAWIVLADPRVVRVSALSRQAWRSSGGANEHERAGEGVFRGRNRDAP
jgi:dihydroneopterin aldolase